MVHKASGGGRSSCDHLSILSGESFKTKKKYGILLGMEDRRKLALRLIALPGALVLAFMAFTFLVLQQYAEPHTGLTAVPSNVWSDLYVLMAGVFIVSIFLFVYQLYRQRIILEETLTREKDFVSLVTHQLRAPMTELSWTIEAATSQPNAPAEYRNILDSVQGIVTNNVKLISDILMISRSERGLLKADFETISSEELIREIVRPLHEIAKRRDITLDTKHVVPFFFYTDRNKTVEAIRNVIDNAIKYSPEHTTVEITLDKEPAGGVIRIKDHGYGIPPEVQPNLFSKATALTKKGTGSGAGLGLYLTKQFLDIVQGRITFETSVEGTTFIITLPTK
jgi:signal transduction histidine kinase